MNHLSDDELVLHYYGEDGPHIVAVERHLRACAQCARAYEALVRSLDAVTPPDFVEVADDLPALRQMIRDRLREQPSRFSVSRPGAQGETGLIALVWLVPLLYPISLQALFSSNRWAQEHLVFIPLVALALIWACAGPFLAAFALNRMAVNRFERPSARCTRRRCVDGGDQSLTVPSCVACERESVVEPWLVVVVLRHRTGVTRGAVPLAEHVPLDPAVLVRSPALGAGAHSVCVGAHHQPGTRVRQSPGIHGHAKRHACRVATACQLHGDGRGGRDPESPVGQPWA